MHRITCMKCRWQWLNVESRWSPAICILVCVSLIYHRLCYRCLVVALDCFLWTGLFFILQDAILSHETAPWISESGAFDTFWARLLLFGGPVGLHLLHLHEPLKAYIYFATFGFCLVVACYDTFALCHRVTMRSRESGGYVSPNSYFCLRLACDCIIYFELGGDGFGDCVWMFEGVSVVTRRYMSHIQSEFNFLHWFDEELLVSWCLKPICLRTLLYIHISGMI